jgi:hypothetical protein
MRRQQLTETQIAALFEPSREQRDLVRHYTLTGTDLAAAVITAASATR